MLDPLQPPQGIGLTLLGASCITEGITLSDAGEEVGAEVRLSRRGRETDQDCGEDDDDPHCATRRPKRGSTPCTDLRCRRRSGAKCRGSLATPAQDDHRRHRLSVRRAYIPALLDQDGPKVIRRTRRAGSTAGAGSTTGPAATAGASICGTGNRATASAICRTVTCRYRSAAPEISCP